MQIYEQKNIISDKKSLDWLDSRMEMTDESVNLKIHQ